MYTSSRKRLNIRTEIVSSTWWTSYLWFLWQEQRCALLGTHQFHQAIHDALRWEFGDRFSRNISSDTEKSRRMQDSRQAGTYESGTIGVVQGPNFAITWKSCLIQLEPPVAIMCDVSSQTTPQHFPSIFQTCLRSATCQRCAWSCSCELSRVSCSNAASTIFEAISSPSHGSILAWALWVRNGWKWLCVTFLLGAQYRHIWATSNEEAQEAACDIASISEIQSVWLGSSFVQRPFNS